MESHHTQTRTPTRARRCRSRQSQKPTGGCCFFSLSLFGAEVFLTQQLEGCGSLRRREGRDKVVSLWRSHPSASVRLAVQLTLDEEVAHLLEVDVTVGADEAAGVVVLVPSLHHCPAAGHTQEVSRIDRMYLHLEESMHEH